MPDPPICDYEGSDYQASFWDEGGREYEDRTEAVALKRLLPKSGRILLELGAGAGRNTSRYTGFEKIVLLDYSTTQLEQAQARLGTSGRYVYVAADAHRLPFVEGLFDAATMIRALHHMVDAHRVLGEVRSVLGQRGIFILEFANKRNAKSILRYWMGYQTWNPFTHEPVEFARLNFDFHPVRVRQWLEELGFRIERILTVSHFRVGILKRTIPLAVLVFLDTIMQWTGRFWQLTPSVFVRAINGSAGSGLVDIPSNPTSLFKCPSCQHRPLTSTTAYLACSNCGRHWGVRNGIFDFRAPELSGRVED